MADLDPQLKSLQEKLQQLLRHQQALLKENQRLHKELEKAGNTNKEKEQFIQNLQQKVDTLKIGAGNLNESDKAALGKKIDGYLKEIDKCIALLNT